MSMTDKGRWADEETQRDLPTVDGAETAADAPKTAADEPEAEAGRGRGRRSLLWAAGIVAVVLAVAFAGQAANLWPNLTNPFKEEQTDRSQPALLESIQDLSRYVAAEGNFQVVIDLERNRRYVPEFLLNERTLLVGAGTVEAYVDFGALAAGAVTESADRKTVTIRLPAPQLGEANLDLDASYVFAEERGMLNRLKEVFGGDPNRQREAYRLAEERIAAAARDSGLAERAQENTRKMLEGLLRSLGYTSVTITFAPAG